MFECRRDARVAELLLRDLDGDLQVVQERRVNVAELMPRAFGVVGGWNCPRKTDSRTASVPILKSGARHHSASGSPMRNPVAAMRLTIVRYGSWSCASRFAKSAPAMMAGAFFRRRCGRCAD